MSKVLMEGAAAGCALVTCDVPGCRELVINGETGFVTPPYDVSALTNAVRDLIRAPKLVKRMGTFGRELAFKKFDESVMARAIANIITN
jgi:glycosyltransferase involved in cell wall biosynthesis